MREKLTTEIYKSAGVPVINNAYARLIINDDIYGLYLISDSLNKRWMGASIHGDEKAKVGISYKLISSTPDGPYCDLKYYDSNYKTYKKSEIYEVDEYEKDEYDPNDRSALWKNLIEFTKLYSDWVETYQNDTSDKAVEELNKFFNIESVLRLMAVDTLVIPLDNFWFIMSNAVLYYNPERKNYQIFPYDFDETMRGSWEIESLDPDNYMKDCITWPNYKDKEVYEHYFTNHLLEHPQIKKRYDIILAELTRTTFDSKTIYNYLTATSNLIRDDVQWNIDAVNNLAIPYKGLVKKFSVYDFERSLTYKRKRSKIYSSYELQDFIEVRGDYCREYTANVDTSDNSSISEDLKLEMMNSSTTVISSDVTTTTTVPTTSPQNTFNVVSLFDKKYNLGIKYNEKVVPLTVSKYPLYSGSIENDNIKTYKYVVLDKNNQIIEEESFSRTFSERKVINEVYNRSDKNVSITELPSPLEPMFPMGSKKYQPIPDNVIYTVYAECEETGYANVTTNPFFNGREIRNEMKVPCSFNIISPDSTFESEGTIRLIGFGSRTYKKLSWSMQFSDKKFYGRKTVKMRGLASDDSFMREKLATSLYKSAGVPVQEGAYARLIINNDIYGLYLISDTLNKKWLSNYVHGDDNAKIGFSYKLLSSVPDGPYCDLKYYGEDYEVYEDMGVYEVDEFEKENVDPEDESTQWTYLINFTKLFKQWIEKYKNDTSDKAVEELEKFLNLESLLRLMAIDTLILPLDNFWLIMSNSEIYYNPDDKRYQFLPFDFDQSLVGSWEISSLNPNNYIKDCITWANYDESINDHYFINNLLKHPQIKERYDIILAKISNNTFDAKTINEYLKSIASLIRDDIQWNIDANNNLNIPYDGDITYLTLDQFDSNYSYRERNKKDNERVRDSYELQEFVNIRGDYCRAYTANIKNYENSKIIDDQKNSTEYHFSVVSILGEGYTMGVKYDDNVVPLDTALFHYIM
eukprot:jgi/Orpsp1_1/1182673/evm.model.c7180000082190.1